MKIKLLAFFIILSQISPLAIFKIQAAPSLQLISSPHPDAGIWVAYKASNTAEDLQQPYIKGVMAYGKWREIYTGEGQFNWYTLDRHLDFAINQVGKKTFITVASGYTCDSDGRNDWPEVLKTNVARSTVKNAQGCFPLQFWDPLYIKLYKDYITALAEHLADFDSSDARPNQTDVVYIRAQVMAVTMENLPNSDCSVDPEWCWRNLIPANGHVYQVDLTNTIIDEYQKEIVLFYKQALDAAYGRKGLTPPTPAAKGGGYWRPRTNRETFIENGIWFDKHSGGPSPVGWFYDMVSSVKTGQTRGVTESGNNPPSDLLVQFNRWEVLSNLHSGVELIGIYGSNKRNPDLQPNGAISFLENRPNLEFGGKYAGQHLAPSTSPGAWIALRGWYPEYNWGSTPKHDRLWTNFESLMTQYRPQDSIALYGVEIGGTDGKVNASMWTKVFPVVHRDDDPPWDDETPCRESGYPDCDYIIQEPTEFLGVSQYDGKRMYAFPVSNLGVVLSCGDQIFCEDRGSATRQETMLFARQTDKINGKNYMRFDVNDAFANSLGGQVVVRVTYLDKGTGAWQLLYDGGSDPESVAITIQKTGSNLWKQVQVTLSDVVFANRGSGGTDLTLFNMDDDDDIFHMIEIERNGVSENIFADVPSQHPYHTEIEALYQAGYTAGCQVNPLLFCPDVTMNRAESAVFVQRGIHGAGVIPTDPTTQIFADLALDSWAAKWATRLYTDGFTAGCGETPLVYCPWQGHTRTEGTVFYLRMLNGADYMPPEPVGVFADVALDFWGADWIEAAYAAGLIPACSENPLRFCPDEPLTRAMAAYMMVQAVGLFQ